LLSKYVRKKINAETHKGAESSGTPESTRIKTSGSACQIFGTGISNLGRI